MYKEKFCNPTLSFCRGVEASWMTSGGASTELLVNPRVPGARNCAESRAGTEDGSSSARDSASVRLARAMVEDRGGFLSTDLLTVQAHFC